jgi:hypothetical protein
VSSSDQSHDVHNVVETHDPLRPAANDQAFFPPTHSGCGGVFAVIDRTVSGAIVQVQCLACGRIATYGPHGVIG